MWSSPSWQDPKFSRRGLERPRGSHTVLWLCLVLSWDHSHAENWEHLPREEMGPGQEQRDAAESSLMGLCPGPSVLRHSSCDGCVVMAPDPAHQAVWGWMSWGAKRAQGPAGDKGPSHLRDWTRTPNVNSQPCLLWVTSTCRLALPVVKLVKLNSPSSSTAQCVTWGVNVGH